MTLCSPHHSTSGSSVGVISPLSVMPWELCLPDRRVRRKTWLGFHYAPSDDDGPARRRFPASAEPDQEPEQPHCVKQVYLVTLPALQCQKDDCKGLVCPSTWKHEDVAAVMLDAFRKPVHTNNNASWGKQATSLDCMVVFRERHAARSPGTLGPFHWHIALKADASFRFAPYKRSLTVHHGIASHWSASHTGFWSAVRYGYIPSPSKQQEDLDPEPLAWHRLGKEMDLFALSQEPTTASALARRRESKVKQASSVGKAEPRPTEFDLYPIIVQQGFQNGPDDHNALVTFAFKNRARLPGLIDDVWSWETVDDFLAEHGKSRVEMLVAAAGASCICQGEWMQTAMQSLLRNGIDPSSLCRDIYRLLEAGRREDVPVLVLMGRYGGEGKSFWLGPLRLIYGIDNVQATPQPGNFPLLGLERKKVALLDDWCFDANVLPLPTQLLWYEGKPFPLTRPQNSNTYNGHLLYRGTAPIFVTCKEKDLGPVQEKAQVALMRGHPSEHTMLLRRLKIYSFKQPLPSRGNAPRIPECMQCFARLLLQYGQLQAWAGKIFFLASLSCRTVPFVQ